MAKSLGITIILAAILSGLGHIYLGFVKRGIAILIVGIVIWIAVSWVIPVPFIWLIGILYWLWQIWDAYNHYKRLKPQEPQTGR